MANVLSREAVIETLFESGGGGRCHGDSVTQPLAMRMPMLRRRGNGRLCPAIALLLRPRRAEHTPHM